MKLPRDYFSDLTASKYKEYLRLLPNMQHENTRIVTTLIFTFFALAFFGIFAINPTITTIVELRKKLADSQTVYANLQTKIQNLSSLQQQYGQLGDDLPLILESVPQNPQSTRLISQILGLAREKNVRLITIEASEIKLIQNEELQDVNQPGQEIKTVDNNTADPLSATNQNSFTFFLQIQGSYEDLMDFARSLSQIQRIVKIESISINSAPDSGELIIDIEGRAFYKK